MNALDGTNKAGIQIHNRAGLNLGYNSTTWKSDYATGLVYSPDPENRLSEKEIIDTLQERAALASALTPFEATDHVYWVDADGDNYISAGDSLYFDADDDDMTPNEQLFGGLITEYSC